MSPIIFNTAISSVKIVFVATIIVVLVGMPLGLLLSLATHQKLSDKKYLWLHNTIKLFISLMTYIPSVLLVLALFPIIHKIIVNHFSMELSAIIAITLVVTPAFAQAINATLENLPKELFDTAQILGASTWQMISNFLLQEAYPAIVTTICNTVIEIISLAIIVSMLGIYGLGTIILEHGYKNLQINYLLYGILLVGTINCIIRFLGNYIAQAMDKN